MKYRLVSLFSIIFGTFLLVVVAAARFAFYVSTISFVTNGANPIQSVQIQSGDALELPEPSRSGYTFGGWYLDQEFTKSANFLVLTNQDKTLYAYWIANLYTIAFDSNGGSSVAPIIQTFDSIVTAPAQPTLPGYDFGGWFLDDETFLQPYSFNTMSFDTNLYAKWTPTIYQISYTLNGGALADGTTLSYTVEDDLVTFKSPVREGHTFNGWFDNPAFEGDPLVAINPNRMSNITLYAKWTVNFYTIFFDANGGSSIASITQEYGTTLVEPTAPIRLGYTFKGWNRSDGTPFVFSTMPVDGASLVAVWEINVHTINLDVNGGDALINSSIEVTYNDTITLATPTRSGYTFSGWSDGAITWQTGNIMPDQAINLTAQWTIIDYPITYNLDRGVNAMSNPSTYTVLDAVTFAEPEREGHSFNGWFKDALFTQPISSISVGSTGVLNLFAKWTINTYTIILDVNEGDPLTLEQTNLTVTFASTLVLPTPTRLGFDFVGWKTADGVTYGNGNIMPAKNLELTAEWTLKTYQVKYYLFKNDVTNPVKLPAVANYNLGQTVVEQEVPNPGYTFDGWFDFKTDLAFQFGFTMTDISEPIVLYGKWTPIVYRVTYNLNDGNNDPQNPETFTIEDSIPLNPPSKPGYTFGGWQSDSVTVTSVGGAITDITLTAQWQLVKYNITYVLNGGTNNFDNPRDYDAEDDITLLPAVRTGYTFTGWKNDNNITVTSIPLESSGNITLTAQWTINKHTLKYRNYAGQTETTVNNKDFGSTLGMPAPTRRGYTFNGWNEVGTNNYFTSSDSMPDRNLTLVGEWSINNYFINYNLDGGNPGGVQTINYTVEDAVSITNPTRTGWTFVGWDKTGDDTADHSPTAGVTTISAGTYAEDITLKAIWTQLVFTLTYNSDGGSPVSSKTFNFGQLLDSTYFPNPTKPNLIFAGWWDSNNARWGTGTNQLRTGPLSNLTLTARWSSPTPYSVTYEPDNGELSYSTSIYPGELVYIGFTPFKAGYTFLGWKEDDGTFYTASSIMPFRNITLTAQWVQNT